MESYFRLLFTNRCLGSGCCSLVYFFAQFNVHTRVCHLLSIIVIMVHQSTSFLSPAVLMQIEKLVVDAQKTAVQFMKKKMSGTAVCAHKTVAVAPFK